VTTDNSDKPVLFFDGVCNLCNHTIQFIIRHDRKKTFFFAPLQSAAGMTALEKLKIADGKAPDSIILQYKGEYYTQSAAALNVFRLLGGLWRPLYGFMLVPPFLRNFIYNLIARNRYKWFGKREQCMLPTPEIKARFL